MAEVRARATLDSKPFKAGLKDMSSSVQGFGSQLQQLKSQVVGAFAIGALASKGARLISQALSKAFEFERYNTEFNTLFKNMQTTIAWMKTLREFAVRTPFQLPEIVEASKNLELFSNGALNTIDMLKRIGDAASFTSEKDFAGLARWVALVYAGLKDGKPIARATNAMMLMGAITGETKSQLDELALSVGDFETKMDVLTNALGRFTGQMEKASATGEGLFSTMKD